MDSLPIYPRKLPSGRTAYQVDLGVVDARRRWKSFIEKSEAIKFATRKWLAIRNRKTAALALDMDAMSEAAECIELLKPHGANLKEAVDHYLRHLQLRKRGPTVKGIANRMVREAVANGRREKTILELKSRLVAFARHFTYRRIGTITLDELEQFLQKPEWGPQTRINYATKISQLYNHAIRHEWIDTNLADRITRPSPPDDSGPMIYTVEECVSLLNTAAEYGLLLFVVLGLFRGVRTHELQRLRSEAINLSEKEIAIDKGVAKKRSRRVIPIDPTTAAWLATCMVKSGEITRYKGDKF